MRSTITFPNGIGVISRKYVVPGCSPAPSAVKNNLEVTLVNISANDQVEFIDVKSLLFISLVLLFECKCINKPMMLHNIHVIIFASTLLALYLFITHPCIFFIFHQVARRSFKFINNGLQTNDSLVNELNFPSFLSLCVFIFGNCFGKCPNNRYINL